MYWTWRRKTPRSISTECGCSYWLGVTYTYHCTIIWSPDKARNLIEVLCVRCGFRVCFLHSSTYLWDLKNRNTRTHGDTVSGWTYVYNSCSLRFERVYICLEHAMRTIESRIDHLHDMIYLRSDLSDVVCMLSCQTVYNWWQIMYMREAARLAQNIITKVVRDFCAWTKLGACGVVSLFLFGPFLQLRYSINIRP